MYENDAANPPGYCDHKPPKVTTIRTGGKVRVQCLTCGTVGPAGDSPGEAFRALLKVPYGANKSDIQITCVTANQRIKGPAGRSRSAPHRNFDRYSSSVARGDRDE